MSEDIIFLLLQDFLSHSPLELMNILNYTYPQLLSLTSSVCTHLAPKSQTVNPLDTLHRTHTHAHLMHSQLVNYINIIIKGLVNCNDAQYVIFVLLLSLFPGQVLSLFNARKLKEQSGFLPTSLLKLDAVLHGGLPTATITEVGME